MKMKNDCERDYIKDAFDKLYNCVMPYIDLNEFANADIAFKELDKKVHSEIYILKKCLAERDRAVTDLNKKIHDLEEEKANLRVAPDDAIRVKSLERANEILRRKNRTLWTTLEKRDIGKRIWHADGNAITGARTWSEMLAETIEFQNKKIEELEAEKTRLKEAVDIQKTTFKKLEENVDLSYGHEFEFGDEVFVPWSCDPYMYIKSGQLYNPRTERLVYVGKDQHLKWFGEKFSIV